MSRRVSGDETQEDCRLGAVAFPEKALRRGRTGGELEDRDQMDEDLGDELVDRHPESLGGLGQSELALLGLVEGLPGLADARKEGRSAHSRYLQRTVAPAHARAKLKAM